MDLRLLTEQELQIFNTRKIDEDPFKDMQINDSSFLDTLDGRSNCAQCKKSRKYFCYTCCIPVSEIENEIPTVELPCAIDIIKHPKEIDGKSTATHAAIIAPKHARIYIYPDVPNCSAEETILIFPGKNSVSVNEAFEEFRSKPCEGHSKTKIRRAIFIDSTWNQSKKIINDERLNGLRRLEMDTRETLFWRYQTGKPVTYLSTIEAIYYFLVDFHKFILKKDYDHEYDNLLFFFKYMYCKIHSLYDSKNLLAYKAIL